MRNRAEIREVTRSLVVRGDAGLDDGNLVVCGLCNRGFCRVLDGGVLDVAAGGRVFLASGLPGHRGNVYLGACEAKAACVNDGLRRRVPPADWPLWSYGETISLVEQCCLFPMALYSLPLCPSPPVPLLSLSSDARYQSHNRCDHGNPAAGRRTRHGRRR